MRLVGFTVTALLAAALAASAQPPVAPPGVPGSPPPPAVLPAAQPDPKLDAHLKEWEKRMGGVINYSADIELVRTDAVFKKERKYGGGPKNNSRVLCMKPNLAILRLENATNPVDYEAFICTGQHVYEYSGLQKTVTEYTLAPGAGPGASDNLMLDFLSGMKAEDVKKRFNITLFKEDQYYVYLDIKPILPKDQQEFTHVRFALYGPATKFAYLPAHVWMMKPSQDTELWKFTNPQTDLQGITKDVFKYTPVPGWEFKRAPAGPPTPGQPPMLPGGTNLPAGPGAVKKP
jgi:TIGR03009 family protein